MAFSISININNEPYDAYIKASIKRCDTDKTVIHLTIWTSQINKNNGGLPIPEEWLPIGFETLFSFDTNLNVQANNPLEYAYILLENSNKFTDAIWNI